MHFEESISCYNIFLFKKIVLFNLIMNIVIKIFNYFKLIYGCVFTLCVCVTVFIYVFLIILLLNVCSTICHNYEMLK